MPIWRDALESDGWEVDGVDLVLGGAGKNACPPRESKDTREGRMVDGKRWKGAVGGGESMAVSRGADTGVTGDTPTWIGGNK